MEHPPRPTSKIPLPEMCIIRKNVFGRQSTFLEEEEKYEELRCSASITQHFSSNKKHLFHSHSLNARNWTEKTNIVCWHCSHQFDTLPIPLPVSYDSFNKTFNVYGNYCSLSCVKRAILEQKNTAISSYSLSLLQKMAFEVYGFDDHIVTAPPKEALKMFGGFLTIDKFRTCTVEMEAMTPPFVNSYLVLEEKTKIEQSSSKTTAFPIGSIKGMKKASKANESLVLPKQNNEKSPYEIYLEKNS